MIVRILSAIIGLPLLLGLVWIGGPIFTLAGMAVTVLALREFYTLADSTGGRLTAELYASIVPRAPGLAMANARALPEAVNEVLGCFIAGVSGWRRDKDMNSMLALKYWEC